ncbi:ribonuclease H-like domain-containing protein [Thioalkalicoccus limnaeus]|uniref:Ribonuclease H-like domain-containing protein n=1 Tax=Thioalkalicoccus limnaeus TaxID=120681 RepID=A0ABV4BFB0_9GAMM
MGLRERLDRLTGAPPPPVPEEGTPLVARLARLRARSVAGSEVRVADEQGLAEHLAAERLAPGVLCREQQLPGAETWGSSTLDQGRAALPELCDGPAGDPTGWRFLDTETSGLAGGTGTWVFQVGILRPMAGGWRLRQFLLARLDAEAAFLAAIAEELAGVSRLVTYNGKSFDRPLLATRFRLVGIADPLAEAPHLDLLAWVRRAFAEVWGDCRLVSAEERLLGLRRFDDLPGAAAPQAWLDWLRQGRVAPLEAVLRHNRRDLLSLAVLPVPLALTYRDPAATGAAPQSIAGHHVARGAPHHALAILEANAARLTPAARLLQATLYRRRGDWDAASRIWAALAEQQEPAALLALAKFHEHSRADPVAALAVAERLPPGPDRDRRCARLAAKLGRARNGGAS